jgi:hypothetical protein
MAYVGKFTGRYMEREMVEFFAAARKVRPDLLFLALTQSERAVLVRELERVGIDPADYVITKPNRTRSVDILPTSISRSAEVLRDRGVADQSGRVFGRWFAGRRDGRYRDLDVLVGGNGVDVLLDDFSAAGCADAFERALRLAGHPACRSEAPTPLTPATVEAIRAQLTPCAGERPGSARAITCRGFELQGGRPGERVEGSL